MEKQWNRHLVWHGKVSTVPCVDHSYRWLGSMPCTGRQVCVFCGKPKDSEEK